MTTRLYPLDKWSNFWPCTLGKHIDSIVGCFFEEGTYDITTIARDGRTCSWECTINPDDLAASGQEPVKKKHKVFIIFSFLRLSKYRASIISGRQNYLTSGALLSL